MKSVPYRSVLGSLVYLSTRTRSDISKATSMSGKFQESPAPVHWKLLNQIVRYLIGTIDHCLYLLKPEGKNALEGWSDADWARDTSNRRSRSGYIITVSGSPEIWCCKLQTYTYLSSSEAEFFSLGYCTREVIWIPDLLHDLGVQQLSPTKVLQYNLGIISWTEEMQVLRKVKHIGLQYHYVRDAVDSETVQVTQKPSSENRCDSLTKVLVWHDYKKHRVWLGVTALRAIEGCVRISLPIRSSMSRPRHDYAETAPWANIRVLDLHF